MNDLHTGEPSLFNLPGEKKKRQLKFLLKQGYLMRTFWVTFFNMKVVV